MVRAQWTVETEVVRVHLRRQSPRLAAVRTIDFDSTRGIVGLKASQDKSPSS